MCVEDLLSEWYRAWGSGAPGRNDADHAGRLIERHGDDAWSMIPFLVKIVRSSYTGCLYFAGAIPYVPEALKALHAHRRREESRRSDQARREVERAETPEERRQRASKIRTMLDKELGR